MSYGTFWKFRAPQVNGVINFKQLDERWSTQKIRTWRVIIVNHHKTSVGHTNYKHKLSFINVYPYWVDGQ